MIDLIIDLLLVLVLVVWVIIPVLQAYRSNDDTENEDWEYCTIAINPEAPPKVYNEPQVVPQHLCVVEQSNSGTYRYRPFIDALSSSDGEDEVQSMSKNTNTE